MDPSGSEESEGPIQAAEDSMPIYEYECSACGNVFERVMKVGEEKPECPDCGEGETKKRVAPFRTNAWSSFLDRMERRVSPEKFK
jgi:putative FmdB family regulatory protein